MLAGLLCPIWRERLETFDQNALKALKAELGLERHFDNVRPGTKRGYLGRSKTLDRDWNRPDCGLYLCSHIRKASDRFLDLADCGLIFLVALVGLFDSEPRL
jgi:hypothetical protein